MDKKSNSILLCLPNENSRNGLKVIMTKHVVWIYR